MTHTLTEAEHYNPQKFFPQPQIKKLWYVRNYKLLQFDFNIHASRQIQLHQRINRLVSRVDNVHQTLVSTDFKLVARSLVDVRRTQHVKTLDTGRQWHRSLEAAPVRLAVSTISSAD